MPFRFSKALLPTHSATFGYTFLGDAKKVLCSWETEGLCKGAAIKVADSLSESMWFAAAGGKETSELSSLAGCKREHLVHGCRSARWGSTNAA